MTSITVNLLGNATSADIGRIYVVSGVTALFDRPLSDTEMDAIGARRVNPGGRFKRTVRCPVNGDGFWYWCRELLTADAASEYAGAVFDGHGETYTVACPGLECPEFEAPSEID